MDSNNENEIEVLNQTGVVDIVSDEKTETEKKKPLKKTMTMNLKTLFLLGIGAVILICGIVALIVALLGKKYTVSFDTDGGNKIASIMVKKGKTVDKPNNPIKKDYSFVEWQLNGKKYDFSEEVTKNITLKAKWEIKLTDELYTIVFDTKGGSEIESQSVNGNGKIIKPETPTRMYSRFVEWQLDGKPYDFESLVKKDMTLVATWEMLPKHEVTFEYDGGGEDYIQIVYEGEGVKVPEIIPDKEGYTFVEWQKDGQKYDFKSPVIDNITLKAKYAEAKQYEVKFNSDGGSAVASQKVYEGSSVTKPNDPTKANYLFGGWQLNGKNYDFDSKVTKDITLRAKWDEVKTCTVKLVDTIANGGTNIGEIKVKCGTTITLEQVNNQTNDYCTKLYSEGECNRFSWYLNNSKYDFSTLIKDNITLNMNL